MNRKNWFFIGMFLFVVLLFTILYAIGFINYFFEDSEFFIQMKFLDFGSKLLAFFYLIVLSIFFSVVIAIMVKIVITPNDGGVRIIKTESKSNSSQSISPQLINDMIELTSKKIFNENEKRLVSLIEDASLLERVDDIYYGISQMISDLSESLTALELFEKTLYWGSVLSGSKRGSIMIADKDSLNLYKTSGWKSEEKLKTDEVSVKFGQQVSGKVAEKKQFILCNDLSDFQSYDFPEKKRYETESFISFPIMSGDRTVAVFNFTNNKRREYYSVGEAEILRVIQALTIKIYELILLRKRETR